MHGNFSQNPYCTGCFFILLIVHKQQPLRLLLPVPKHVKINVVYFFKYYNYYIWYCVQYLEEMKSKSVRIIIGDVYDEAARDMMCQAFHLDMTAYQSYVWFLPGWLSHDWYDTDHYNNTVPCTTQQMRQVYH